MSMHTHSPVTFDSVGSVLQAQGQTLGYTDWLQIDQLNNPKFCSQRDYRHGFAFGGKT